VDNITKHNILRCGVVATAWCVVLKFAPKATALDSTSVTHNAVYNTNIAENEQHGQSSQANCRQTTHPAQASYNLKFPEFPTKHKIEVQGNIAGARF
jgi:hypothetical protein